MKAVWQKMSSGCRRVTHIELTEDEYHEHDDDGTGFCLTCGEEAEGYIEPDACDYLCEKCQCLSVHGIEQLMLMGKVEIVDEGGE